MKVDAVEVLLMLTMALLAIGVFAQTVILWEHMS